MNGAEGRVAPPAVELHGVGKRYWKLDEPAMLLRSMLPMRRPKRTELWALRDLDLAVGEGETVGVIGRNGAGKTTVLRLLAGVTRPTDGRVRIGGRVAPLISVGVGFHPEMTGRENVFVNGMLLGLIASRGRRALRRHRRLRRARASSSTRPVKFYSSGMFLRLGFAVAVHVDPSVLLIDEVLAVGDYAFQLKCLDRMRLLQSSGTTIVIVTPLPRSGPPAVPAGAGDRPRPAAVRRRRHAGDRHPPPPPRRRRRGTGQLARHPAGAASCAASSSVPTAR